MAYSEKYIMSFVSERGNDYRVVILQQNYTGEAVQKKLGVAPVLSIESGDGRIQGSSLAFSIQSDTEGELRGLYTTNNKEFKALLYRNGVLYWQGYLLPELYSENYIHPPYDVAVTATDQLATLKDVAYAGEDAQTSLLDIIKNILSHTQINLQCKVHMNLNDGNGISVLRGSYISAATYNGQSCYDALNAILLSCNCSIMQMGNQWLITSFTDYSYSYDLEGSEVLEAHATIGQMHQGDVWPSGSLNMVNAPALKGAKVDYNHTLRNSFLRNADITSRESWMYTPDSDDDGRFPGVINGIDGKSYKCHFWQLWQQNLTENDSLQLWQDVRLDQDAEYSYSISVKYLFANLSDLLLMAVSFLGDDGVNWRLTADGWTENFNNKDVYSYIQITSNSTVTGYLQEIANISNYEIATVRFNLPAKNGKIRIGFINSTDYKSPFLRSPIYLTQVYFSIEGITGHTATTEVEKMATSVQEELLLSYGDKVSSSNGERLTLNTLRDAEGAAKSVWNLSGREFPSYYMAMLQEYSRYYGCKKMQLQGVVMGKDAFRAFYIDTFSGLVMRLLSGQYNLLEDEVNISLEEVVTSFVDYDTVVYATDNKPQQNNSSSAGAVVSGGGATTLGGLINVDDNVDEVDTEVQVMIKDVDSKVWGKKPLDEVNFNKKKTSEYLVTNDYLTREAAGELYAPASVLDYFTNGAANDALMLGGQLPEYYATNLALTAVSDRVTELEKLFYYDAEHDAVRTSLSLIVDQWLTFGGAAMGSGSVTGATTLAALNDVQITEPTDGQSLVYDSTLNKWVNKAVSGGTAGSVAWDAIVGRPTTLFDWHGYLWNSNTSAYDLYQNGVYSYAGGVTNNNWPSGYGVLANLGSGNNANKMQLFESPYGVLLHRVKFDSDSCDWRVILDSANCGNYALPITGGTINGTTATPLIVNTTNSTSAYIRIDINNSGKAAFGWNSTNGAFIYNRQGGDYLRVGDDHHPYFNDKVLLHSGNYTNHTYSQATIDSLSKVLKSTYGNSVANDMSLRPTSANVIWMDKSLRYFLATSSMIDGKPAWDSKILHLAWDNSGWNSQVAVPNDEGSMQWRGQGKGDATIWGDWKTLLDSVNYRSYALPLSNSGEVYITNTTAGVVNFVSTSNVEVGIRLFFGGSASNKNMGGLWYNPTRQAILIHNSVSGANIGMKDSGVPFVSSNNKEYRILHSGANITYDGSLSTSEIIRFLNNVNDVNGNGIAIGGGGRTIIGGGESASLFETYTGLSGGASAGDELMVVSNDGDIYFFSNCQNGISAAHLFKMSAGGVFSLTGIKMGQNYDSDNRAKLEVITTGDNPCDFYLGTNNQRYWSLTARNTNDNNPYGFGIYNSLLPGYALVIRNDNKVVIGDKPESYVGSNWLSIVNSTPNTNTLLFCHRTDTNYKISFGVGSGGINRGVFDDNYNKWLLYASNDGYTYLTNNVRINQDQWANGLIINRTVAASGASILVQTQGVNIGAFGINGNKIFEFTVYNGSTSTTKMTCDSNGNLVAQGAITFKLPSDRRLKSNIRPLTYRNTIRVLHRLRPVSFEWNKTAVELDSSRQGLCDGFIADEYEGLIPNSGRDIWEKYRAIDYTRAIPYLAKGWQIHESELDKMRRKVKIMEMRIEHLENLLVEHNITAA